MEQNLTVDTTPTALESEPASTTEAATNPKKPIEAAPTLVSPEHLEILLGELRLKHWSRLLKSDLAEMKPLEQQTILRCLNRWAETEKAERKGQLIASKIRSARFRMVQTIDQFNFTHSNLTRAVQKNYMALFNSIAQDCLPSAVFTGTAGMGKTHLARSLGYAACQKGVSVLFVTAAEMVNQLATAQKNFKLENELAKYRRPQVLIIDELGYVSLDAQASNLFFQVISARHDQGLGTIATTNLPFGKFNQIFANDAIAHAIVDRLVNSAEVFYLEGEGETYREFQRRERQEKKKSG
jgi:DNA replication protein DnaC